MDYKLNSKKLLNDGRMMPYLGLGVYDIGLGGRTCSAVLASIECGYRHFDTASLYGNEDEVGEAVRNSGVPREKLFVTTKVWNSDQGYEKTLKAFDVSLKKMKLDYIDLYLLHWPVPGLRLESWKALEKLYREGYCKSIGVSNFIPRHLEELISICEIKPAVNQIEMNPFLCQLSCREYCKMEGIHVTAYSPLTSSKKISDPRLRKIAEQNGKSPAQVMLRWGLQHGISVIPKSSNPARIRENSNIFDFSLNEDEMLFLDALDEELHTDWDPNGVP